MQKDKEKDFGRTDLCASGGVVPAICRLPDFPEPHPLWTPEEVRWALRSPTIEEIRHHVLGPSGTNISQAAGHFDRRIGICHKSRLIFYATPEEAIEQVLSVESGNWLAIAWTCAVYVRENQIFFHNPDFYPFALEEVMPLDTMQLACRPELANELCVAPDLAGRRILSHPSPVPLIESLRAEVIFANSNADAAARCAAGEAEACITTETARGLHGLIVLHVFGSPNMAFFGGVSRHSAALIQRAIDAREQ